MMNSKHVAKDQRDLENAMDEALARYYINTALRVMPKRSPILFDK